MQAGGADNRDVRADGLRPKVLDDERPAVVSKKADVIGSIEIHEHVPAKERADLIEDALGQAVEVGEIIGNGQYRERASAVSARESHGIAGEGGVEVDDQPVVVLKAADLDRKSTRLNSSHRCI